MKFDDAKKSFNDMVSKFDLVCAQHPDELVVLAVVRWYPEAPEEITIYLLPHISDLRRLLDAVDGILLFHWEGYIYGFHGDTVYLAKKGSPVLSAEEKQKALAVQKVLEN